MRAFIILLTLSLLPVTVLAAEEPVTSELAVREIHYDGQLTDSEARFTADIEAEALGRTVASVPLFDGDVAVLTTKLPEGLRLARDGKMYRLMAARAGRFRFKLDLVVRIKQAEPWNQISFTGPAVAIASVTARAGGAAMEVQLQSGTLAESWQKDGTSVVRGFLGTEQTVALRWQSKAAESARRMVATCETSATAHISPTVVKYTTQYRFEIPQGSVSKLSVAVPKEQALTRVEGQQIRDWRIVPDPKLGSVLAIEFIKPVEKAYDLRLFSEQTLETATFQGQLTPPQPLEMMRESGSFTVSAEDVVVEVESAEGLRQVNAPAGSVAAYQYHGRPVAVALRLKRIEAVVTASSRVTARLEEARLLVSHTLTLRVEKAGIYAVELAPLAGMVVADVRGNGVEDWNMDGDRLRVSFASRVLDARKIEVQLEQALKTFPEKLSVTPLRVAGATRQTAQIGAAAAPGIRLKSDELTGVREVPVTTLSGRSDELLAYAAEQADWKLVMATERLAPRVITEVFNLLTIGDGLVGASATIRYAILNQGVQELRLRIPPHCKNIEFTGPNIRRKEQQGDVWVIGLQDKVWGGYTLVVTYDFQFDPHQATLPAAGIHTVDTERETGSIAITSAASMQIRESRKATATGTVVSAGNAAATTLVRMDESELAGADRALITRPVLLAYKYEGGNYELTVDVTRFEELPVLQAVADRTQLTTVLTDAGQMLSQASFMVKNNNKQFQEFVLPAGADFWSCYVNNRPVKAERDDHKLLVPLPRGANRDQVFAVDIVYAQKMDPLRNLLPRHVGLVAPQTDIQTTYAEWELYVPESHRLAGFGGNMTVAKGTEYGWRDAWLAFCRFYDAFAKQAIPFTLLLIVVGGLVFFVVLAVRRGWRGAVAALAVVIVLGLLAAMLLPALSSARGKAWRANSMGKLRQVDQALPMAAPEPSVRNGVSSETATFGLEMAGEVSSKPPQPAVAGIRPIRIDVPKTGARFVFTKVLNVVGKEPLTVRAWAVDRHTRNVARSVLQLLAFLIGLAGLLWEWRKLSPGSLRVTAAAALALGSVISLLVSTRMLHVVLIIGFPVVSLAALIWLAHKFWKRFAPAGRNNGAPPPVIAALILLMAGTVMANADSPQGISILSAAYTGTVREKVAQVDAELQLNADQLGATVALFGEEVAVQQFTVSRGDAKLVRNPAGDVSCVLARRGTTTVKMKFLVKLTGDVVKRRLLFDIPPALSSRVAMTIEEPEAAVEMPTAVSFKITGDKKLTRFDAIIGAGAAVDLRWTPRVKRAAEIAATVFCQSVSLVRIGDGVVNIRSQLDYQVTQGEVRQVRVQLPAGQRLLRVEGETIRTWESQEGEAGTPVVSVELIKGVSPSYRLTLETEGFLEALPAQVRIETPHALDVKRETGIVALRVGDDVGLSIESTEGLTRVDADEFARLWPASPGVINSVYRFLKPEFGLRVRAEALQPQIEAVVQNHMRLGTESATLQTQVDYTIKRAAVFTLQLAVPDGYSVSSVSGDKIAQWNAGNGVLKVTLKERIMGAYTLRVHLVKWQKELARVFDVDGAHPLGAQKLTGYVSVATELGIQAKTAALEGVSEIPASTLPSGGGAGVLAYKFIATEPGAMRGWKLSVATEVVEAWVRAEVVNFITLNDTLLSGRALVRYDIQNAPVKELRLRVPAAFKNVEINGENIRRRDHEGEQWRVELQHKVSGTHTLTVTWEQSGKVADATLDLAGVEVMGVERETGVVAIHARPPLQAVEKMASVDLVRMDTRELPEWAGRTDETMVLAYRYLRPGYKLAVTTRRFEEAQVLQALVDSARLTTVVANDGQMMTELALALRNNGRQFLEISLPKGAQVWSAFVAGRAVRPTLREGKLLLPLDRSGGAAASAHVELTYIGGRKFPSRRGRFALETPSLDVPLKNARWELYLPADYAYGDFAGTMTHEIVAQPAVALFSLSEYSQVETRKKAEVQSQVGSNLYRAKGLISSGKLKEASDEYNVAMQQGPELGDKKEFEQVEKDLRRAQASHLVSEQERQVMANAPASVAQTAPSRDERKDQDLVAAEQQAEKLNKAQEVAAAKVLPLRVNLPTHGVRHAFTQVLQTEVGKPMTVQFAATNTRAASWPMRILAGAIALGALWALVSAVLSRRQA